MSGGRDGRLGVGIIGAGRVGPVIGAALAAVAGEADDDHSAGLDTGDDSLAEARVDDVVAGLQLERRTGLDRRRGAPGERRLPAHPGSGRLALGQLRGKLVDEAGGHVGLGPAAEDLPLPRPG